MILRTRTRARPIGQLNRGGFGFSPTSVMATSTSSAAYGPLNMGDTLYYPMLTTDPSSESIQDENPKATRPWDPRGEHYVTHTKTEPAVLTGAPIRYDYYASGLQPLYAGGSTACWNYPSFPTWTVPWASMLDSLCSQVQGYGKNNSLILVSLKELGETIGMIRNPYNLIKGAVASSRKRGLVTATLERLSSTLLETTFGWKALYSDIGSIAKSTATIYRPGGLASSLAELDERFSATQSCQSSPLTTYSSGYSESTFASWSSASIPQPSCSILKVVRNSSAIAKVNATLLSSVRGRLSRSQNIFKLATAFGLTNWKQYRDFLWEICPYSFVFDWFFDTRGIWAPIVKHELEAMNLTRISYSLVQKTTFDVTCKSPAWWWYNRPGAYRYAYPDVYLPLVLTGSGYVKSYVRTPGFPTSTQPPVAFLGAGLSLMQYALSGALAVQRLV